VVGFLRENRIVATVLSSHCCLLVGDSGQRRSGVAALLRCVQNDSGSLLAASSFAEVSMLVLADPLDILISPVSQLDPATLMALWLTHLAGPEPSQQSLLVYSDQPGNLDRRV
jgi:hypothetical protein